MYKKVDLGVSFRLLAGGPVICVSTESASGISDIMTAAWNCPFDSNELIVVLDKTHTTSDNILHNGKLVISVPSNEQLQDVLKAGSVHGRDCGDKFAYKNLPAEKSEVFGFKCLKNSLAQLECELIDKDLFKSKGICLVRVVNAYAKDDCWDDQAKNFANGALKTLHHVSDNAFATSPVIVKG